MPKRALTVTLAAGIVKVYVSFAPGVISISFVPSETVRVLDASEYPSSGVTVRVTVVPVEALAAFEVTVPCVMALSTVMV